MEISTLVIVIYLFLILAIYLLFVFCFLFRGERVYGRKTLLGSGWPVDDAHVRRQLVAPVKEMPPFARLPPEQLDAPVAYLKAL